MAELDELRAKFLKAYSSLPEPETEQVIVVMDKPFSWNKAFNEIVNKTALGNNILKKLKAMEIL